MGSLLKRAAERITLRGTILFLIALSIAGRFVNINGPLWGRHAFRQTQTALTVREWLEHGVRVFDYITPVFGPNSCIPFEFPTYQLSCYFLYKCLPFLPSLDMACILANLIWFFLSAYMLHRILLRLFPEDNKIAFYGIAAYMISPYTIYWSHTSMIDYCSVFFALGYAEFFAAWIQKGGVKTYILLLFFGSLAYLSKVTTVVGVVPFIAFFILRDIFAGRDSTANAFREFLHTPQKVLGILFAVAIPLGAGAAWAHYADLMKIASGYPRFTSQALIKWNFGTLPQRLELKRWWEIIKRIFKYIVPYMWGLSLIAFFAVKNKEWRLRYGLLAVCAFLPIFVFFNLYYVHDYYLIAVSPFVCAFAGACFYELEKHLQGTSWLVRYLICISLVVSIMFPKDYWNSYFKTKEQYMASDEWKIVQYVNERMDKNDSVLILGNDWSSHLQYYVEHPAATLPEWKGFKVPDMDFGWIVCGKDNSIWLEKHPNRKLEKQIGKWKVYKIVQ